MEIRRDQHFGQMVSFWSLILDHEGQNNNQTTTTKKQVSLKKVSLYTHLSFKAVVQVSPALTDMSMG